MPETTAKVKEPKAKVEEHVEQNGAQRSTVRKTFLASVGAVAMAEEEIEDLISRLIDKGKQAEREGRKILQEALERRRKQTAKIEKSLDERVESLVEKALARMNIPTKSDLERLSDRIAELTKQVEELKSS